MMFSIAHELAKQQRKNFGEDITAAVRYAKKMVSGWQRLVCTMILSYNINEHFVLPYHMGTNEPVQGSVPSINCTCLKFWSCVGWLLMGTSFVTMELHYNNTVLECCVCVCSDGNPWRRADCSKEVNFIHSWQICWLGIETSMYTEKRVYFVTVPLSPGWWQSWWQEAMRNPRMRVYSRYTKSM